MSFSKTVLATFLGALGALYVYDNKDHIREKLSNSSVTCSDDSVLEETKNSDT